MADIMKWQPFRELENLRREIDDMFRRFFGREEWPALAPTGRVWSPPVESFMRGGDLVFRAELPGVDPKEVEISVVGNQLTIRGERQSGRETKEKGFLLREFAYGSFERALPLPEGVNPDKVSAKYTNGVLEITMPVPKAMEARVIPIET